MATDTLSTESGSVDESALLAQARVGDPASCGALVDQIGGPVFHYLYWLTGSDEAAADLFKDTLLQLYLNPSRARKARSRDWAYSHATESGYRIGSANGNAVLPLDHVLRGGLRKKEKAPWADWMSQCPEVTGPDALSLEPLVDGLIALSDHERAALLLTTVADFPIKAVAASLRISPRKSRRRLASAFARLVTPAGESADSASLKINRLAQRRALGLASKGQAKALDKAIATDPEINDRVAHCDGVLATLNSLPRATPPESLTEDTTTHLAEGHAALETRIATWGFRFMQVTVPLFILAILAIMLLPAISRSREEARRAAAADNLRAVGEALRAYSDAAPGNRYPRLTATAGLWVPDLAALYPKYISDPALLVSPSRNDPALVAAMTEALTKLPPDWEEANKLLAQSYVYTGYALLDGPSLGAFMKLRMDRPDMDLDRDLETSDRRFYRLRQGVEQFFVGTVALNPGEAPSGPVRIPVMFEVLEATGFGGNPEGANVLYLDGIVAYVPFGSAFPVDATVMALLDSNGQRSR